MPRDGGKLELGDDIIASVLPQSVLSQSTALIYQFRIQTPARRQKCQEMQFLHKGEE